MSTQDENRLIKALESGTITADLMPDANMYGLVERNAWCKGAFAAYESLQAELQASKADEKYGWDSCREATRANDAEYKLRLSIQKDLESTKAELQQAREAEAGLREALEMLWASHDEQIADMVSWADVRETCKKALSPQPPAQEKQWVEFIPTSEDPVLFGDQWSYGDAVLTEWHPVGITHPDPGRIYKLIYRHTIKP
jgi:hypothetical protein